MMDEETERLGKKIWGVDCIATTGKPGCVWPSEPAPQHGCTEYAEFTITTDPTEAPADALLEGAGYYVEPGDRIQSLWSPLGRVHYHCRDGKTLGGHYDYELTVLKPEEAAHWGCHPMIYMDNGVLTMVVDDMTLSWKNDVWTYEVDFNPQSATMAGTCAHKLSCPVEEETCTRCNGSGQVAGALGVGLTWTCGECEGSGVV